MLIKLVKDGKVNESRLDSSLRRVLRVKFELGLFDDPFVDIENAERIVGKPEFKAAGEDAQRRSIVLLKNDPTTTGKLLPLKSGIKVYIKNIDPEKVKKYAEVVSKPEQADVAIMRIKSPSYPIKGTGLLGKLFSSGDLDFKGKGKDEILKILTAVPSVVDIYLDRPAVIPEIKAACKGLLADFGADDAALLDIVFGKVNPSAHLPFELPSSMEAVRNQKEDMPYDSGSPLFPFGFGLSY